MIAVGSNTTLHVHSQSLIGIGVRSSGREQDGDRSTAPQE
jgi:hypothetical protein